MTPSKKPMLNPLNLATQYGFRIEYNPVVPHLVNGTILCRSKGFTWEEASEKWGRYFRDGKANGQSLAEHWPDVLAEHAKEPTDSDFNTHRATLIALAGVFFVF